MNKKIIISLSVIAAVAAIAISGTVAYFSDVEKSTGNTLTAGVVDIVVNGHNPWEASGSFVLEDMKPCQTRYIEFTVRNLEVSNPINLWKHIDIVSQVDGVITEPECTEGNGTWTGQGDVCTVAANCCNGNYVPRNNLAAYIIYDMYVCADPGEPNDGKCETDTDGKPTDGDWQTIISEDQYVRLDNVSSAWIYLGQLDPTEELKVVQSYHLSSWPDAPEPEVTNWAQGDILTFNIDLYAEQQGGPGPKGAQAMVTLEDKDPVTWNPKTGDGIVGTLTYNTSGPTFDYSFTGKVPQASTGYCLIYYADPWPGDGMTHSTGMDIECQTSDSGSNISFSGNKDLSTDLPNSDDQNAPGGAKIWVVLDDDYDNGSEKMTGWNPSAYLFEMNLINYDDTDV